MKCENKQGFCDLLLPVLQATRAFCDAESISYEMHPNFTETVTIWFSGRATIINVTADSCAAMLIDITKALEKRL